MKRIILTLVLSFLSFGANAAAHSHYAATYEIVGWGKDDYNQVSGIPIGVRFQAIAIGHHHGLALKADGSLVSWGPSSSYYSAVTNTPAGNDFVAIAAGADHGLALKTDGSIVSWGRDTWNQVTNTLAGNGFVAVAAGYGHSLALSNPPSLNVDIDIRPARTTNTIHTNHDGTGGEQNDPVKVGVLGSSTLVGDPIDFAVVAIDDGTVRFGPAEGAIDPAKTPDLAADLDSDGLDDATFEFRLGSVGISCGETEATLKGETTSGQPFEGTDVISTVCNAGCH